MTDTGHCALKLYGRSRGQAIGASVFGVFVSLCVIGAAVAQTSPAQTEPPPGPTVAAPTTINPRLRLDPPPLRSGTLRFLTSDDNPPFNFAGPDGGLTGYNIDLARAICSELKVACTIQARRADLLPDALASGAGDAILPAPGETDARVALTLSYLPHAARFAWHDGPAPPADASVAALDGRTVGVVAGSPFAMFLGRFFPSIRAQPYPSRSDLLAAFRSGEIDLVFADAAELAYWLNGVSAGGCCRFLGGAFLDVGLFGAGHAIAVRAADEDVRRSFDAALTKLDAKGVLTDLYLRYFPVPVF